MKSNAPIVNTAVAWKCAAQKRVAKFFKQAAPERWSSRDQPLNFAAGGSVPGSAAKAEVLDARGNPMRLDDTDDDEPKVNVATAFDADVWPVVANNKESSVAELQETIVDASRVLSATASDADFGTDEMTQL